MQKNNIRFDLSPYLIHFFRSVDLEAGDGSLYLEEWGPHAIVESTKLTPLFLLRNAMRLERLWATWSVRNGKRTVYGPDPAVCFTDMPIAAFIEAAKVRAARGEAMSTFAIVLPKNEVHKRGARPVIYGLSSDAGTPNSQSDGARIFPASVLPEVEQYRYVTLATDGKVDWTHEREWRWPSRENLSASQDLPPSYQDIPGLDLHFNGMGVIVRTKDQADKVIREMLYLHDTGSRGYYNFVLVTDEIVDLTKLREPSEVNRALKEAVIDLYDVISQSKSLRTKLIRQYEKAVGDVSFADLSGIGREVGGCWLWLTDPAHPMTRALISEGTVHINHSGRYLVDVPFSDDLPLSDREELVRRLAALLHDRHDLAATYHSVLGSHSADDAPHYSHPPLQDRLIFNYGDDADDT